ncbi:MAG: hypothetical protein K2Q10_02570, partial [Rhodospirillales bacterium]|nr:hypothetical protein [Rhodospirillales bacterium]
LLINREYSQLQLMHHQILGDRQFLFRHLALNVQIMGDEYGTITPLQSYDYTAVARWLDLLDALDPRSDYAPAMAAHYFGAVQDAGRVRIMVDYLRRHTARDPTGKWRWLTHAAFLARHRAHDLPLALEVARQLAAIDVPDIPVWTKQMPAFVLAEVGEREAARDLMAVLLETSPNLSPEERNYMRDYIDRMSR